MAEENFNTLEEILNRNIAETTQTKNLNLLKLFQEMEQGFKICGFREDYKAGGGGVLNQF